MPAEDVNEVFREMAADTARLKAEVGASLADVVADWLVPQYAMAARERLANASDPRERWRVLRTAADDLVALRRGDHCAARLELEREKFAESTRIRREAEERARRPKQNGISPETLKRIEEELKLF